MKSKNPALENSLACLQHLLTLLSIAILLLNDHVLKVISPSWWTGKLSDFAGLFFFPFIVAAGLSLVLSKFNLSRQRIGQIAFGFVTVWFVLLKTVSLANFLTAQFASLFIGAPTRLILDPTDMIALVVLLPAWILWKHPPKSIVLRKAYISLAVGVVACLASSPKLPPFDSIGALAYHDGILYARSSNYEYEVKSTDIGNSWISIDYQNDDTDFIYSILSNHELPIQACDPVSPQTCYQANGTDKVSISHDGGETWQIAWEVPPVRREYVAHVSGEVASCDLIIVEESGLRYLFVAMGNIGILRRQLPDGEWTQLGVEKAQPAPLYATDLSSVFTAIRMELIIWLGVAFLSLLFTHVAIWQRFQGEREIRELVNWLSQTVLSTFVFLLVEVAIVFGLFALLVIDSFTVQLISYDISEALVISVIVLVVTTGISAPFIKLFVGTNNWIRKTAPDGNARSKIVLLCVLTVISVLFFGATPWPLWALGIIERYQLALSISVLVSGLITATGYYLIRKVK